MVWDVRPTGNIAGTAYVAAFRSPGAYAYECRLDDGAWQACGSGRNGHVTGGADEGAHTLDVRGVDGTGPGPVASTTFTLDGPGGSGSDVVITLGSAVHDHQRLDGIRVDGGRG